MNLYRIFVSVVAPFVLLHLLWTYWRGKLSARDLRERLGASNRPPHGAPVIWFHGASNGELSAARWTIETVLQRVPNLHLVVTANTVSGRSLVASWGHPRLSTCLAPLDHRLVLARFLWRWHPRALVVLESEIWPNRFAACARRRIRVLVIAARISEKAAARWRRAPWLAQTVMENIHWLSAQEEAGADLFCALGVDPGRIGPVINLKATAALTAPEGIEVRRLAAVGNREDTFLAASTHAGEDEILINGFATAYRKNRKLRMILAPRHPDRAPQIERLLLQSGLPFSIRSKGQMLGADSVVYLADTMGEMSLWYRLAGMTFVGGSLVDKGGHTPFEPAAARSAILHGPHVANFAAIYLALKESFGAVEVHDADNIAVALGSLANAEGQRQLSDAAAATLRDAFGLRQAEAIFIALARAADLPLLKSPARGWPS